MENVYLIVNNRGNYVAAIMYNMQDEKYHFVNLTKGYILPDAFENVDDAEAYMHMKQVRGEIQRYVVIK